MFRSWVVVPLVWLLLLMANLAEAAPIINETFESYASEDPLSEPSPWCNVSCGGAANGLGHALVTSSCDSDTGAPTGNRCAYWDITANQTSHYNEVGCATGKCTVATSEGDTIYLGFQMNYSNPNGDVWHDGAGANSGDKGLGIHSPSLSGGYRWDIGMGCWDSQTVCQDHRFTMWIGNPGYHWQVGGTCGELNDIYDQNVAPYSSSNAIQLEYNRWHNVVGKWTMSQASGRVELWIDGHKVFDCGVSQRSPFRTMETADNNFSYIEFGGTIAQPAYDTPAHRRHFDNVIVTKDQADINFLLSDPAAGADTTPPTAPTGLSILQIIGVVSVGLQILIACSVVWARRAYAMRSILAIRVFLRHLLALWWAWRYSRAVRRWQWQAPLMLPAPLIEMQRDGMKENEWRVYRVSQRQKYATAKH